MPVKTFGNLTIKMFKTMESDDTNTFDVLDLFERLTLDAIGLAGFGTMNMRFRKDTHSLTTCHLDFDFNALGDKNNKWVHYYDSIKIGMANPFFMIFPAFDTKWVHWFKKRQQVHDNMAKFKENLDNIITEKRALVAKNMSDGLESEKDLLTLMIESEMSLGGETMSNEELRVSITNNEHSTSSTLILLHRATSTCLCLPGTTHRATRWPSHCMNWRKTLYVLLDVE
jgi:cytochrome P450